MQVGGSPWNTPDNRQPIQSRERRLSDLVGGLIKRREERSHSRSRIERNDSESRSEYMVHLLTIRKNLEQAPRFVTEQAAESVGKMPAKNAWLHKRSFLEKQRRVRQEPRNAAPVSCQKELINWTRVELELIAEEYKLSWIDFNRLREIITFKSLLEFMVQMMRGLASRMESGPSRSSKEQAQAEVRALKEANLVLRRSQQWASLKLEEVRIDWKEASEKINRLHGQLDLQKNELFRLGRLCETKDEVIAKLENELHLRRTMPQGDPKKLAETSSELQYLRAENARLNTELHNNKQTMCRLERIISEKDEQYDRINSDKSRLLKLYANLERQKLESSKFYEEELLATIKKLCDDRQHLSPGRTSHLNSSRQSASPHTTDFFGVGEALPQNRKQILDLIVHLMNTLQRREDEYKRQRTDLAKSRQKLLRNAARTSQQLDVLSRELRQSASRTGYHTASAIVNQPPAIRVTRLPES